MEWVCVGRCWQQGGGIFFSSAFQISHKGLSLSESNFPPGKGIQGYVFSRSPIPDGTIESVRRVEMILITSRHLANYHIDFNLLTREDNWLHGRWLEKRLPGRIWFSANNLGSHKGILLGSFYCAGNRLRRVTIHLSTCHLKCTQCMVVVITIRRSSMKAISSWQHVGQQGWVTQETWALPTKISVTTTCKRQNKRDSWLEKPHLEFIFTSHPIPHCPALRIYLWISAQRSVPLLSNSFSSSQRCLLSTWYMKSSVLGTREMIIFYIYTDLTS